jgi:glucose-6-phosphate isomerase
MQDLYLSGLFETASPLLEPDLFKRMAPVLEGLRHALLSQSKDPGHPFHHLPPPVEVVHAVRNQARALRREASVLVVAGVGGSSLGPKVLCSRPGSTVRFLEGVDPETLAGRLAAVPWEKAALNIVSKSGGTMETLTNAALALERLKRASPDRWRHRVVVTASPGQGRLQNWALEEGIPLLEIPDAVGGRYSVLTPVGLLPAAFDGVDPSALATGARAGADRALLLQGPNNPALALALVLFSLYSKGRTEVDLWGYGERCHLLALWLQQLWGESLGRRLGEGPSAPRVGPTPLVCRGSEDQHSLLQLFLDGPPIRWVFFFTSDSAGPALSAAVRSFATLPERALNVGAVQKALWRGTERALVTAEVPTVRYHLGPSDATALGEAFFVLMAATLYTAALFEIDPFGQPGVEAGKRFTREFLERG